MTSASRRVLTTITALGAAGALVLLSGACGTDSGSGAGGTSSEGQVVTSFYPIQFVTQQITGAGLPVAALTKPGAEPHDLELAPQDVAGLMKARLVIYADGFQPAVDEAMAQVDPSRVLDVADAASLTLTATEDGHDHGGESKDEHADHSSSDPHFWLDPQRYAAVAQAIAARLGTDDPAKAATYAANAEAFAAKLTALDGEFTKGLASCDSKVLVTSHAAFGYLAQRYGLEQHGISGDLPRGRAHRLRTQGDLGPRAQRRGDDDLPGDARRAEVRPDRRDVDRCEALDARPHRGHHHRVGRQGLF